MKVFRLKEEINEKVKVFTKDQVKSARELVDSMEMRLDGEFEGIAVFIPEAYDDYHWELGLDNEDMTILVMVKD